MDEFQHISSRNVCFQTAEPWQGKFWGIGELLCALKLETNELTYCISCELPLTQRTIFCNTCHRSWHQQGSETVGRYHEKTSTSYFEIGLVSYFLHIYLAP